MESARNRFENITNALGDIRSTLVRTRTPGIFGFPASSLFAFSEDSSSSDIAEEIIRNYEFIAVDGSSSSEDPLLGDKAVLRKDVERIVSQNRVSIDLNVSVSGVEKQAQCLSTSGVRDVAVLISDLLGD